MLAGLLDYSGNAKAAPALLQHFASSGHSVTAEMSQLRAVGMSARDMRLLRLAYDIACRMARAEVRRRPVLGNWQVLIDYLQTAMAHEQVEQFRILFLDRTPEEKYAEYEKAWRTRVGDRRFIYSRDSWRRIGQAKHCRRASAMGGRKAAPRCSKGLGSGREAILRNCTAMACQRRYDYSNSPQVAVIKTSGCIGQKGMPRRNTIFMPTPYLALLIGGVLPACLWAITAILQKLSTQHNLGPGPFLMAFGAMVLATGLALSILPRGTGEWSWIGLRYALVSGLAYAIATGLISYALLSFGVPISKLAPVLGCNVLITVLLGVFLLGEGASLNIWKAVGGTVAVMLGLALVISA